MFLLYIDFSSNVKLITSTRRLANLNVGVQIIAILALGTSPLPLQQMLGGKG